MTTNSLNLNPIAGSLAPSGSWLWHGAQSWAQTLTSALKVLASSPTAAQASRRDRAVSEAADVRELAQHYRRSDPGFASDLYAAADRHEVLNGA